MAKTQQDLIVSALQELNALGVGETPSAEDADTIRQYVEPRVAQLAADRVLYVSDVEEIPDEVFIPLAKLIANAAAPKFGQASKPEVDQAEESKLRRQSAATRSRPARIEYF